MQALFLLPFLLTPEAPLIPGYLDQIETTSARYVDCVRLIEQDLDVGRRAAERWASDGGGAPALHCLAVSDLASGFPKLAAVRLTEIAERADAGDARARSRILAEAALAWIDAREFDEAEKSIAAAKELSPGLPELDFVAAKSYAAGEKWQQASDAVDAAEKAGLKLLEAYLIRAKARRALGRDREAADDVVAALSIDPLNIEALTLRGDLARSGVDIEAYYGDGAAPPNKQNKQ